MFYIIFNARSTAIIYIRIVTAVIIIIMAAMGVTIVNEWNLGSRSHSDRLSDN